MIFSIIYHNFVNDNCFLFHVKLINHEITNNFYQQLLPTTFNQLKINKLIFVVYLLFSVQFVNAQVDCSEFGINITVHPQNCYATFIPKVPAGITPDYYSWVLYNSFFDTCATSEDEVWKNYFCFDDTYEVELNVYFNGGANVCTIYETVTITCTNNSCSRTSSNPFPPIYWRHLYLEPGCYGTNYKLFFKGISDGNGNCGLYHVVLDYYKPTNVLVTPCHEPGPIIHHEIEITDEEELCIWALHGSPVCIKIYVPATCCNQELCFEDCFTSSPYADFTCPGFICSWPIDSCEAKKTTPPDWQLIEVKPGQTDNMIGSSDDSYAIEYTDPKISHFEPKKSITQIHIIDIDG